jgi:hypothetical protein
MKNFIYLFVYLFIYSCKAQNNSVIDLHNEDVFIFKTESDGIKSNDSSYYFNDNFILLTTDWSMVGSSFWKYKSFIFIQKKDTMRLIVNVGKNEIIISKI